MLRSSRLVPYVVPRGGIPTAGRSQIYPKGGKEQWILGLVASNVASAVARFRGEKFGHPKFQNSMVGSIPYVEPLTLLQEEVADRLKHVIESQKSVFAASEVCIEFVTVPNYLTFPRRSRLDRSSLLGRTLDLPVGAAFGLSESDMSILERDLMDSVNSAGRVAEPEADSESQYEALEEQTDFDDIHSVISYAIGVVFGRWDIRYASGEKVALEASGVFAPLPVCPPGQLQNEQGLPITREDVTRLKGEGRWHYPLEIPWDGILVDDPGHPLDFEARVHQVLQIIWKDRWEAIEREACEIMGVRTLRDYFRSPPASSPTT